MSLFDLDHAELVQEEINNEKIVNVPCNHHNTVLHLSWSLLLECV